MAPIVASDESLVHSVDKGRDKFAFHAKGNPLHACGWNLFPKKRQHFLSMSHYWLKKPPAKKKKDPGNRSFRTDSNGSEPIDRPITRLAAKLCLVVSHPKKKL